MSRRCGAQNALCYASGSRSRHRPGPPIPQHAAAYSQAASSVAPPTTTLHAPLHRLHHHHQIPSPHDLVALAIASSSWSTIVFGGGARRLQSTQRGHSNLELHPTPIDYSIFEEEHEDDSSTRSSAEAQASAQSASSHASPSSLSAYAAPSPSQVVEGILRSGGSSFITEAKLTDAIATLRQFQILHDSESEAGGLSDMGQPPPIYLEAAYTAFTKGRPTDALYWIRAGPAWPDDAHGTLETPRAADKARKQHRHLNHLVNTMLVMLSGRATRSPASLRNAIVALVGKGYHASELVAQQLVLALKDALHVLSSEKGQARELWKQLLAAHESVRLATEASIQSSRTFLTMALNAIVRHLALKERREEAMELVEDAIAAAMTAAKSAELHGNDASSSSSGASTSWSTPLRAFTYRLFLKALVDGRAAGDSFAAYRIQASLQQLAEALAVSEGSGTQAERQEQPPRRSPKEAHPQVISWSASQASLLAAAGARVLLQAGPSDPTKLRATASTTRKKATTYHSEGDIVAAIENGKVGRARRLMMLNLSKAEKNNFIPEAEGKGEFAHLPSARLLAIYQDASLAARHAAAPAEPQQAGSETSASSSSSTAHANAPLKPSWLCEDAELEEALAQARAGKGLWQTAHLWRLHRSRQFADGLAYFDAQFHRSPDLPPELVSVALEGSEAADGDEAANSASAVASLSSSPSEGTGKATVSKLWPSSYAVDFAVRCVIDLIRAPSSFNASERHDPSERLPIVRGTLGKLERCYQLWRESVTKHALLARSTLRAAGATSMSGRKLDSHSFDAWIVALASERQKEDGITLWKAQREVDEDGIRRASPARLPVGHNHSAVARWPSRDAAAVVASLRLFDGMTGDAAEEEEGSSIPASQAPLVVSRASHRALEILANMQDLDVEPSASTYTIVLDTLARDAGSSYRGAAEDDGNNAAWRLVLHLAERIGLVEGPEQHQQGEAAVVVRANKVGQPPPPLANLITYSALLGSLLTKVPEQRRDASDHHHLDKAVIVQQWLADAVRRASSSSSSAAEGGKDAGPAGNASGAATSPALVQVRQADVAANGRVMELLKSLSRAVRERQEQQAAQLEEQGLASPWEVQQGQTEEADDEMRQHELDAEDGDGYDDYRESWDEEGGYRDRRAESGGRW